MTIRDDMDTEQLRISVVLGEFEGVLSTSASADSDFFDLGGTSLNAAQLAMRLTAKTGMSFSFADILKYRTPENLSLKLGSTIQAAPAAQPPARVPSVFELSTPQRAYHMVWQGDALKYGIMYFTLQLPDGTEESQLRQALTTITSRHDALRMSVESINGRLQQRDMGKEAMARLLNTEEPSDSALLRVVIVVEGDRDHVARIADSICSDEQSRGLEANPGPLFRCTLVRQSGDAQAACVLVMVVHHMIFDGASYLIFTRELAELLSDNPGELASAPSFGLYSMERTHKEATQERPIREWWRNYLSDFEGKCFLPSRHPESTPPAWKTEITLPEGLRTSLAGLAASYRIPASVLRLAAIFILAHALCRTEDVIVLVPLDNRPDFGLSNAVGQFVDELAIRHRTRTGEDLTGFISGISSDLLEVMEHQGPGFDLIVQEAKWQKVAWRWPLSGLEFNGGANSGPATTPELADPRSRPVGRRVMLDIQMHVSDWSDRTDIEVEYPSQLLAPLEAEGLLRVHLCVLSWLCEPSDTEVMMLVNRASVLLSDLGL